MRTIYFEVNNGEVIYPAVSTPAYSAVVDGAKVIEMKACFSQGNIDRYGQEWKDGQIVKSKEEWTNYKWLKKSLKKFALLYYLSEFPEFEETLKPQYVYIPFMGQG